LSSGKIQEGSLLCPNLLIKEHICTKNHEWAVIQAEQFICTLAGDSVALQMNKALKAEVEKNRTRIKSVCKALNLIGRYELPLRGDGEVNTFSFDEPKLNDDVLRAILGLMGQAGDPGVKEVFIEFRELTGTTGKKVADSLLDSLKMYNFNINEIVAQGYDGASNMSSRDKGVHGRIKEIVPTAEYFWCAAHRLNLVTTDAAADLSIAQTLSCIKEIINYLNGSVKRASILKNLVEELVLENRKRKLKNICPTRWVERHEALLEFKDFYPTIYKLLKLLLTL
uniref:DUF4371 domain-containing protein n=1 Tax=Romanomermis culicivorax TaxID=13658 RepID=A0A915HT37_ROMCU